MKKTPSWKQRKCRKCGRSFPWRVKVCGKVRNTKNRKFCLKCSPFGSGNTKPDDPVRPSKPRHWAGRDPRIKKAYKSRLLQRAEERKRRLVAEFGGGCSACGYDRSTRALAFYRCGNKVRRLSADGLWSASWNQIVREAGMCRLLCLNCLAEFLEGQATRRKIGTVC